MLASDQSEKNNIHMRFPRAVKGIGGLVALACSSVALYRYCRRDFEREVQKQLKLLEAREEEEKLSKRGGKAKQN